MIVGVSVMVGVGVIVGVEVGVGVCVGVGVIVAVGVGVKVAVEVSVGVEVKVGVILGVEVEVAKIDRGVLHPERSMPNKIKQMTGETSLIHRNLLVIPMPSLVEWINNPQLIK